MGQPLRQPKCRFGVHRWVHYDPVKRRDGHYEYLKVCIRCGKQKVKVKLT